MSGQCRNVWQYLQALKKALGAAIVSMAKTLSLGTIAEGVENEMQAKLRHGQVGDQRQDYLFSRPFLPNSIAWRKPDFGVLIKSTRLDRLD